MTDLVQKLVWALEETLLFCETFSNRWDGQTGAHPFGMVKRARASLSEAKAGGWQPIETMPEEGKFLVFMPTQRVNQIQAARCHNGLLVIGNAFAFDISDKPTHWQPLPNPPKEQNT